MPRHPQVVSQAVFDRCRSGIVGYFRTDDRREYSNKEIAVGDEFLLICNFEGRSNDRTMLYEVTLVRRDHKRPGHFKLKLKRIPHWND